MIIEDNSKYVRNILITILIIAPKVSLIFLVFYFIFGYFKEKIWTIQNGNQ